MKTDGPLIRGFNKRRRSQNLNGMKHLFLISISLFLFSCKGSEPEEPKPDPQIIPGQGIKEIKIGDSGQMAVASLGTGTTNYTKTDALYYHYIVYADKGIQLNLEPNSAAAIDLTKKIEIIELFSPYSGQTEKETGIGSTQDQIRAAHGNPDVKDPFIPSDKYNSGIEFYYNETSLKVTRIILNK